MKKKDVQIGKTYIAKVSNKLVPVKILRDAPYGFRGGWIALNTTTGREIHVKSAARLRREVS